eukprot:sb/3477443/
MFQTVPKTEKIRCPVHLPSQDLDLSSMVANGVDLTVPPYTLCGVIHHHGGYGGGHYTVHTRDRRDEWRYYNDVSVSERAPLAYRTDGPLPENDSDARSAYVLLYKRDP